ncbi:MAG: hypothetical protein KAJ10_10950 [Thermodesulfovibrionia bacterium]|nr:hypothetical protein [Thermodesulfovibrionia bacterium]
MKKNDVCVIVQDKPFKNEPKHNIPIGTIVVFEDTDKYSKYPIYCHISERNGAGFFRPCELEKIGEL